jgi:ArsR family transcriptional regulator
MDLAEATSLLRLLSDSTRVRLLALLRREELTVAEISSVLGLAQPRVSTHLAKLKEAGLVRDRRAGVSAYYRINDAEADGAAELLGALEQGVDDALLESDAQRLPAVLARRARERGWADSVAGDMERHYSPGRTWEALARSALPLMEAGDVLDIASGDGVLAASERLRKLENVEVREGDMHALPFGAAQFDLVVLMHALTYSEHPAQAVLEAARVLRPGGRLLLTSLARHEHRQVVEAYGHVNLGFTEKELQKFVAKAGLDIISSEAVTRERRPPHFEVIALMARKAAEAGVTRKAKKN